MTTAIGVIAGALISITIVILVEALRRPRLIIEIERPPLADRTFPGIGEARWLRVVVRNNALPRWAQRGRSGRPERFQAV